MRPARRTMMLPNKAMQPASAAATLLRGTEPAARRRVEVEGPGQGPGRTGLPAAAAGPAGGTVAGADRGRGGGGAAGSRLTNVDCCGDAGVGTLQRSAGQPRVVAPIEAGLRRPSVDTSDVTIEQETHKPSRRTAAAAGWCGLAFLAVPMAMHFNWPARDLGIPEWAADAVLVMLLVGIFAGCTAWTRQVRPMGKGVRGFVAELAFLFALSLLSSLFFGGVLYVVALKMR